MKLPERRFFLPPGQGRGEGALESRTVRPPEAPLTPTPSQRDRGQGARAFTLVEVLAALVLLGIVVPVCMRGISVALSAAETAKHMSQAASLGEAKLNEMVSTNDWTLAGTTGDFGTDWPGYRWSCQTNTRDFDVTEIILTVTWQQRGQERSLNVSTMVSDVVASANAGDTTSSAITGTTGGAAQ